MLYQIVTIFLISYALPNFAQQTQPQSVSLKLRAIYYDREFNNSKKNRTQSGSSVILKYQSNRYKGIKIGLAAHAAQAWQATGFPVEDVFTFKDGRVTGHQLLAEAFVHLKPNQQTQVTIGRQQHQSLLLKSKYRALPSTFQGINIQSRLTPSLGFYTMLYNKWSPRANAAFSGFATDNSSENAIDYLLISGFDWRKQWTEEQTIKVQTEFLKSKNYLYKLGVLVNYQQPLSGQKLAIEAGVFSVHDAGYLFTSNAETGELDYINSHSDNRLNYTGLAYYLSTKYNINNTHQIGLALVQIKDAWLEDNFTGDHGFSPFPTSTMGPDLTNKNEFLTLLSYSYNWKKIGLKSNFKWASGKNAENTISNKLGSADEQWIEIDLKYKIPFIKKLSTRLRYRDYQSNENGSVAGVKPNRKELRLTLDYEYHW